ncbi:hypothetical protein WJX73_001316 [Symbiochloris irregularis]|uniref:K Homology domain-containing protein n=1 Tax=Symbiochloris irregularis TaxID=706552 RepID=A0AAW1PH39_9CHLO
MEAAPQRKRRKWDTAAPQGVPIAPGAPAPAATASVAANGTAAAKGLDAAAIARAQQGAAAVMAKINQDLAARGLSGRGGGPRGKFDDVPEISREVTINAANPQIRNHLTKRSTQDDIARRTGTAVVVRGRFMPPGVSPTDAEDKPLCLRITPGLCKEEDEAGQQRALDYAAAEVEAILRGTFHRPGAPPMGMSTPTYAVPSQRPAINPGLNLSRPPAYGAAAPAPTIAQQAPPVYNPAQQVAKLWTGFEPPAEFGLAARIRGPGDAYLQHISRETGVTAALLGRGSGIESAEPPHLLVSSPPNNPGFEEGKRLAQNLIDTVRGEYSKLYPNMQSQPLPAPASAQPPSGYAAPAASYPAVQPPAAQPYQAPQPHATPQQPAYPSYPGQPQYPAASGPPAQSYPPPYQAPPASQYPASRPPTAHQYAPPQQPYYPGYPSQPHQAPYHQYPPAAPAPGAPQPYSQQTPPHQPAAAHGQNPQGYPPPYQQAPPHAYTPPGSQGYSQPPGSGYSPQQQHAPPAYAAQPGASPHAAYPPPGHSTVSAAPRGPQATAAPEQQPPPKRRFQEVKQDAPQPLQVPPHQQPVLGPGTGPSAQGPAVTQPSRPPAGAMGPPPPKVMGPPPPKFPSAGQGAPMGPPPPKYTAGGLASADANVLGGLVGEYGDDD